MSLVFVFIIKENDLNWNYTFSNIVNVKMV